MNAPEDSGPAELAWPTLADCHPTDVMMGWTEKRGHAFFSVVAILPPYLLVQNQEGYQFRRAASSFAVRYSLKASAQFNLRWRVSPIEAVAGYKAAK